MEGDPDGAIREITERAARTIGTARTSVWLLDETAANLTCVDLYELAADRHSSGTVLHARDFPAYFAALLNEDSLAAADAHADPRTSEFSTTYLGPLGIGAMLDAPIRIGGRLVGVLCHEHVGPPRVWSVAEREVAAILAGFAAMSCELKSRAMREALLAATLESTGEGILATDGTRVVAFNQRFVEMWRIDAALLRSFDAVRRYLGEREDAVETVQLEDGRVFERSSRPQMAQDRVIGRVWSFRDVTAQLRAEAKRSRG